MPARFYAQGSPRGCSPAARSAAACEPNEDGGLGLLSGVVGVLLCLAACFVSRAAAAEEPLKLADSALEPLNWSDLKGWTSDDHLAAFGAYQTSCQALRKMRREHDRGPISDALGEVCGRASAL